MLVRFACAQSAVTHFGRMYCRWVVAAGTMMMWFCVTARAEEPSSVVFAVCECTSANTPSECTSTSANFTVRTFVNGPNAADVARHCEHVCARLRSEVFSIAACARWQPKCNVVLHASREAYRRAVGAGASQTVGSSSVSLSGGRVTKRHIDLLATDLKQSLAALPHELVHVLFADEFPTTAPPKWVEEGLALSMDSADKRSRHARDLEQAIRARTTLPLSRLVSSMEYPEASQRAVFYAQSLSLVDYLTRRSSHKEFVRYAKLSTERGHDHALSAVYGLRENELSRGWWKHVAAVKLASWDGN